MQQPHHVLFFDPCQPQLVDISKLGLNSKIKKFSCSFICGKGDAMGLCPKPRKGTPSP